MKKMFLNLLIFSTLIMSYNTSFITDNNVTLNKAYSADSSVDSILSKTYSDSYSPLDLPHQH